MKKNLIYSILLTLLSLHTMAQVKISGKVTDVKDNSALPGVSIKIKGTQGGTQTDLNGNYTIQVTSVKPVLIFSYTGYASQEISTVGKTVVNVQLAGTSSALNEVVVIGYGTVKKSDLTGAVTGIKGDQLNDKPVANVTQALQGKIAGVEVSVNSTAPARALKYELGVSDPSTPMSIHYMWWMALLELIQTLSTRWI
ncbi:carboxypeptidase-like regulatory domain-containing protein [Mucilaginibacter sp. P25]|uniref:carboxypeptidase-like regulatory domain-containing protein n=1 Tax=Mucilaginibacter sp. P25 TaxID=3423945 RepID=UPI003D799632